MFNCMKVLFHVLFVYNHKYFDGIVAGVKFFLLMQECIFVSVYTRFKLKCCRDAIVIMT